MSYLDIFNQRNSDYGNSIRNLAINATKRNIIASFPNNPSYYSITINTASTPTITSTIDSWIVDDPNQTKEVKQITLIPDVQLNYGDLVYWNTGGSGDYWLITTVDYMGSIYYRGSMQKCYSSIKWQDSTLTTREAYFTVTKDAQRGLGIVDGKVVVMPNERRFIAIQNNVDTFKIVKGQRFIFDNGRAWWVTSVDTLKTGLIELELEEQLTNSELDNVSLRICNYQIPVTPPIIYAGLLYIISPTSPLNQIKENMSKTYQGVVNASPVNVTWSVFAFDKVSSTTMVSISSTTSTSCVLKANNADLYGSVQLKATLQSDPSQYYWQEVDVIGLI